MTKPALLALLLAACGAPAASTTTPEPLPANARTPIQPEVAGPSEPPEPPSRFPPSRRGTHVDTYHGTTVADPYRWLEDASQPEVKAWMDEQDRLGRDHLAQLPGRDALARRFRELYYIESYSPPRHEGKRWFFSRKHVDKEKSVVYYRDAKQGPDKVLLDPNTLSADGSISLKGYWPSQNGRHVAYKLARNAADHATLYIRDLDTGKDLPDTIEGARYASADWTADSKGFYYTWLPTDPAIPVAELPGRQEVRYHRLGTDPAKDEVVVAALGDPTKFIGVSLSRDGRWLLGYVSHGWTRNDVWYKDLRARARPPATPVAADASPFEQAGFSPLAVDGQAHYNVEVWKDVFYINTDEGAPRWRVFSVPATKPARERWKEIVAERADATLDGVSIVGGHLIVAWLRNAQSELEVRRLDGKLVRQIELPGLGSTGVMSGRPDEDEAYFGFATFTEPTQIFQTSVRSGKSTLWQKLNVPIDTSNMTVEQVWYTSKDGTKVSMFLVHRKDLVKDGKNPTYLTGYGGFSVSTTPVFSAAHALFVEHGGVVALPNLRGGSEYGEDWHKAGMRDKKQNVFDDFIGAAEWLIAEKVTSPDKLAISGGSNGGLLVGAAMVQRPELFRAVICSVPLLDMVRYHLFGSGKTWIEEYGSADDAQLFPTLFGYSPYHRVAPGTRYPALLMHTADSDDRVDPMHARKFTAAIQWATRGDAPVIMRIEKNAGHGGADLVKEAVERSADTFAFVFDQLGMK